MSEDGIKLRLDRIEAKVDLLATTMASITASDVRQNMELADLKKQAMNHVAPRAVGLAGIATLAVQHGPDLLHVVKELF